MSFIKNLDWRYATKKFDSNKKIPDSDLQTILESIRKTPTSLGIMPFRAIVISDLELRQKLKEFSWNQAQIDTSSELIVFVARTDLTNIADEFFIELSGNNAEIRANELAGYENMVNGYIANMSEENILKFASEQAHIALGFALAAAAELNIDSCAIGGFDSSKYSEILGLSKNEVPVVLLALGYRDSSENPRSKFRLSADKIFKFIK